MEEFKISYDPLNMEEQAGENEMTNSDSNFDEVVSLLQQHGYRCEKTDYGCIIGRDLFLGVIDLDYLKTLMRGSLTDADI